MGCTMFLLADTKYLTLPKRKQVMGNRLLVMGETPSSSTYHL
jgi:hypothetical protein